MAKGDKFYFENFATISALSKEAALYLVECLENHNPDNIQQMLEKMHAIEHPADSKKREMNERRQRPLFPPLTGRTWIC